MDTIGAIGDGGAEEMERRLENWATVNGRPAPGEDELSRLRRVWPAYFASPESAPPMPDLGLSPASGTKVWDSIQREMASLAEALRAMTVPIGFLAGESSPLLPELASQPTSQAISGSWVSIVEGSSHFPWLERPGSVKAALDRLLAG